MKTASLFVLTFMLSSPYSQEAVASPADGTAVKLSQDFLYAIKIGNDATSILQKLGNLSFDQLTADLHSDQQKLAFWINLYNASTQYLLKSHPEYFQNRSDFYKRKAIKVAGIDFSLDEIEHGILRRNTNKLSLGYFRKFRTPKHLKKLMVKHIDGRIHFALNCGAKSCPPVFLFAADQINEQLDLSAKSYLSVECELKDGKLHVPALFSWFRGDFGNKKGIYRFLHRYEILKQGEKPELIFKDYNWELSLGNYF